MRLLPIFVLTFMAALPVVAAPSDAELMEAVRAAYPVRLANAATEHRRFDGSLPERTSLFEILERSGTSVTAFAVHSDGDAGAAQILTITGGTAKVVAEWPDLIVTGLGSPRVELQDVDGDGRPELWAIFPDHRLAEITYIFRRTNGGLSLISPTVCDWEDDTVLSDLLYPETIDLDGDKILELFERRSEKIHELSSPDNEALILRGSLLKLTSGRYRPISEAVFFERFARETGQPDTESHQFYAPTGAAELVVINGVDGKDRVSSAEITLNGVVVVAEPDLNQQVKTLKVPVSLKQQGVVSARLAGKPTAAVLIYIAPKSQAQTACD